MAPFGGLQAALATMERAWERARRRRSRRLGSAPVPPVATPSDRLEMNRSVTVGPASGGVGRCGAEGAEGAEEARRCELICLPGE